MNLNDHSRYVSITMEFRCNLKCTHCMIEGTMDWLKPATDKSFEALLDEQQKSSQWDGLILTGSEITLRQDLPDLAKRAKRAGFRHIRIQTHGMHLSRPGYLDLLMDAGIDEFFVSFAGHNAETHDSVTKVTRSFDKMMQGLLLIEKSPKPAKIITNTVVTAETYLSLDKIVETCAPFTKVVQHEFWNYFPMKDVDDKLLIVDFSTLMPKIMDAIEAAQRLKRGVEVKNIPQCLLGKFDRALINQQPTLLIDPEFWNEFDKNGFYKCVFRSDCKSLECLGLTDAYIKRFGWEREVLSPIM